MVNRNLQGPEVSFSHCTMIFFRLVKGYVFDVYHVYQLRLLELKPSSAKKIDSENEAIILNGSHFVEACNCYLCLSSEC